MNLNQKKLLKNTHLINWIKEDEKIEYINWLA